MNPLKCFDRFDASSVKEDRKGQPEEAAGLALHF